MANNPGVLKAASIAQGYEGLGGYNEALKLYFPYEGKADKKGVLTIGRGHVLTAGDIATQRFKNGLTLAQVDDLYEADMKPRIERLAKAMGKFTDDQFAGALSMFYNCEKAWTPGMTPYREHRAGNFQGCAKGILLYVLDGNNQKCLGLWRRRMSEALCYLTGEVYVAKSPDREKILEGKLRAVLPGMVKPTGLK